MDPFKNSQELIRVLEGHKASVNTQEHFEEFNLTLLDSNRMIPRLLSPPCIFLQTTNSSAEEKLISGTYCHPDLIPSIAGWISPIFQVMANRVVNGCIALQYKYHVDKANEEIAHIQVQLEQTTKSKIEVEEELANHQAQLDMLTELEL